MIKIKTEQTFGNFTACPYKGWKKSVQKAKQGYCTKNKLLKTSV